MADEFENAKFPFPRPADHPFDLPAAYAEIRESRGICPVTLWNGSRAWLVTKAQDFRAALSDNRFSNQMRRPGFPTITEARVVVDHAERSFNGMDEPEHTYYRRMLTKEFTAKRLGALRPQIEEIVDRLLTQMIQEGPPVDLVKKFAAQLPALVMCHWFGADERDCAYIIECLTSRLAMNVSSNDPAGAARKIVEYVAGLIAKKEKEPADDVLSRLVAEYVASGQLTREELAEMGALVVRGGFDTTASMIALSTTLLIQNPEQRDILVNEPEQTESAINELLRYLSPVQYFCRRMATEDIELGDITIPAGEGIFAPTPAANRDPSEFKNPDMLDLRRNPIQHLAFGYGTHQCLGQVLARLELQIALPVLFKTLPNLKLAIPFDEIKFKSDIQIYGIHELPVTW